MNIRKFPGVVAVTAIIICINALWLSVAHIVITLPSLSVAAGIVALLAGVSAIYTYLRPDERLAALGNNAAKILAYSISMGILSCLLTTLDFPLIDPQLAAVDHALGFDWPVAYKWVWAHRLVANVFIWTYNSVIPQVGILVMLFVSLRQYGRIRLLIWLYIVTSLSYILIAAVLPAEGTFGYYKTDLNTPYVIQYYALRDNSMRVFDLFKLQGTVQFPSFHLVLAVICTYVARGMPRLFPILFVLNAFTIAATPVIGGHFLTDLLASVILITPLIFVVERSVRAYDSMVVE